MIMKKHLFFYAFMAFVVVCLVAGCHKEEDDDNNNNNNNNTDPTEKPVIPTGNVPTPDWPVPSDYDYSSSMTVVAQVDLTETYTLTSDDWQVDTADLLAAFAGEECIGVTKPVGDLFFLYIIPPTQDNEEIQLRYYSTRLRNVFQAKDPLTFVNGDRIGGVNDPLKPLFESME